MITNKILERIVTEKMIETVHHAARRRSDKALIEYLVNQGFSKEEAQNIMLKGIAALYARLHKA